ncbi:LA_2444/LA_4059 family outer membrane protein [Leptospira santarosai]|uniref:Outer membrane protein, LA_2444/LA_4059 family n=1 Tax=Leptospira santarosai str. MOR084 TaxID=1049984 RepID=A0A0E2BH12_9LEPT|nr:LA_2444/LA_4059 family outer membrane protein [Leptospira santarosai]EKO34429.1 outer membrane protein, LA_2444/LA_4059 family [Leptospira santarosai str. MOR084]EMF92579.1 outer membrane protein, TIGR04327 family [Leptospira santarosai str. ST188]MDI7186416.1 LA_2444/LA_4059 family outer membrane protein [Leptospira santarosai]MDI7198932.1 LA_2444/LA_4059 family outer membrane protein [Leptospira santarosai]UZN07610.1 LA_2444/LA_4059 family outer membrane protein [Leptospira santarosai]
MNSHSLRPMKKHIEKSIPFLIMILFFIIQTTAMGQNNSSSDPDILEKEADELEIKAGKAQDSVTRQRMIFEIRKKRKEASELRDKLHEQELSKVPKGATFEITILLNQASWIPESLARKQNVSVNETNTFLYTNGLYQNINSIAGNYDPHTINNTGNFYSNPQGNTKTAYPIRFLFLTESKKYGVEATFLDFKILPSYSSVNINPTLGNLNQTYSLYGPQLRRTDIQLNLLYFFQTGSGTRIGPSLGIRNLDIYSKEYGNLPGGLGFGTMEEKAGGLGPQIGFRIVKRLNNFFQLHANADYFRTLGKYHLKTNGATTYNGAQNFLIAETSGSSGENLVKRRGYQIDAGLSFFRTNWLKFTFGFQYTEMRSSVTGYNYNLNLLLPDIVGSTVLNTITKTVDLTTTRPALQKETIDTYYGFYLGVSITL